MLGLDPSIRNRLLALTAATALLGLVVSDLRQGWLNSPKVQSSSLAMSSRIAPRIDNSVALASQQRLTSQQGTEAIVSHENLTTTLPPRLNPTPDSQPYIAQTLPQFQSTGNSYSRMDRVPTAAPVLSNAPSLSLHPELLETYRTPTIDWQISEPIVVEHPFSARATFDQTAGYNVELPSFDPQVQLAAAYRSDPDSTAEAPARLPPQPSNENRIDVRRDPGTVDVGARSSTKTPNTSAPSDSQESEDEQRPRRTRPQNESANNPPDTPERLGVPPPKEQPQFLRDSTVLLSPGEYQFEWGITYTTNVSQTVVSRTLANQTLVANLTSTSRNLQVPLEFRVGVRPDVQGFISLPIGYAIQDVSLANTKDSESVFGIGDLGMGLTRVLRQGEQGKANILGTLACSAPTGATVIPAAQQLPGASLGSGFWTFTGGLTAVKSIDPVAVFFGINYTVTLDTALNNEVTINPGDILSYRLGTGFAINSRISLSTVFEGNYIGELQYNDRYLSGTAREPFTVRIASTIQADPNRRSRIAKARRAKTTEPYVRFGLSDASPDVNLGIRWTY